MQNVNLRSHVVSEHVTHTHIHTRTRAHTRTHYILIQEKKNGLSQLLFPRVYAVSTTTERHKSTVIFIKWRIIYVWNCMGIIKVSEPHIVWTLGPLCCASVTPGLQRQQNMQPEKLH